MKPTPSAIFQFFTSKRETPFQKFVRPGILFKLQLPDCTFVWMQLSSLSNDGSAHGLVSSAFGIHQIKDVR